MPMNSYETRKVMEQAQADEAARVQSSRAHDIAMKGTFQQNADLQRQLQGTFAERDAGQRAINGTWDARNKAAFEMQRTQDDAANWRTLTTDATQRRGQDFQMQSATMHDVTARRGQDMGQENAIMNDATTRRSHDLQRETSGWHYPVVKQYDEQGQVTGEAVVPYHMGKPVNGETANGNKSIDPRFKGLKVDQQYADWLNSQSPEVKDEHARQLLANGNTQGLKFLVDDEKRRSAAQNQAPQTQGQTGGFSAPGITAAGPLGMGATLLRGAARTFSTPQATPATVDPPTPGPTGDLFQGGAQPQKHTGLWRRDRSAIPADMDVFGANPPSQGQIRKPTPYPGQRISRPIPRQDQ